MPRHDPKQRTEHQKQAEHLVEDLFRLSEALRVYTTENRQHTWQVRAQFESHKGYVTALVAAGLASGEVLF